MSIRVSALRRLLPTAACVLLAWTALALTSDSARAQDYGACYREPGYDLFYNYYVGPGTCGVYGAQMYPSPRPVPGWVGATYITYPPFDPHNYLWVHSAKYPATHVRYGW